MPVRFRCHGCHRVLSALDRKVGAEVNCPGCGTLLIVPAADAVPAPPALRHGETVLEIADSMRKSDRAVAYGSPSTPDLSDGRVLISRRVLYAQAILIAVATGGAFVAGTFVGTNETAIAPVSEMPERAIVISGRVTFRTRAGESLADEGSAVLILPADRLPRRDAKLEAAPLNPTLPQPERGDAVWATIESLGGAYARTDTGGEFRVSLPQPGKYHLLILSRNLVRAGTEVDRVDLALIGEYVFDAVSLVGEQEYAILSRDLATGDRVDHQFRE